MTCIVGIRTDDRVFIGGDSAGVSAPFNVIYTQRNGEEK